MRRVEYVEEWGTREAKLAALADPSLALRACVHTPKPPQWRLVPTASVVSHPEYDAGWSLTDAMPVNTTAPVTARDAFVVAFTRAELCRRIAEFRDLAISDDDIRRRYFQRTRSSRYERGDTRGWKLAAARRAVAADDDWERKIVRCLYRPFDWRWVFWHPAMIDWPRTEVTRHLESSGFRVQGSESLTSPQPLAPLCLITRRQQLPSQPCTFFWISDGLALDGVIRSDNRGSESLFPLYLFDGAGAARTARANFAPEFVKAIQARAQLAWQPLERGDLRSSFGPEDLLGYVYGLFHAPAYRERHAEALRLDFPRVLLPRDVAMFAALSRAGSELMDWHLMRRATKQAWSPHDSLLCSQDTVLRTEYPRRGAESSKSEPASPNCCSQPYTALPADVESFRVGGYVALRKWLQPRHRSRDDADYRQIAAAIGRTLQLMHEIDAAAMRSTPS